MKAFMDFEGNGQALQEITSFGIYLVDNNLNYIDSYERLVKSKLPITPFVEKLTGITNEMIKKEQPFDEVLNDFYEWIRKKGDIKDINYYVWGNDFLTLKHESKNHNCTKLFFKTFQNRINYQKKVSKKILYNNILLTKSVSLSNMKELLDLNKDIKHGALPDAIDLYNVYKELELNKKTLNEEVLKRIYNEKQNHITKMKEWTKEEKKEYFYFPNLIHKNHYVLLDETLFKLLKDGPGLIFNDIQESINNVSVFSRKRECTYDGCFSIQFAFCLDEDNEAILGIHVFYKNKIIVDKVFMSNNENRKFIKKVLIKLDELVRKEIL